MQITKNTFKKLIKDFNFPALFIEELGWNNPVAKTKIPIAIKGNKPFILEPIAEKSGFKILVCSANEKGQTPDYQQRNAINLQATKLFQEHIIIYVNTAKTEQIWQVPVRKAGQPLRIVETRWYNHHDPELLYQRTAGVFFDLDEEGNISIVDVTARVSANFANNIDKITKKFYDGFKKEHTAFLAFIKGIDTQLDQDWYASLMLNRLMFCYFIQKKGFLDQDRNYLRNHLNKSIEKAGKDQFFSFYRSFLLRLFHQVLNTSKHDELVGEFGQIPYLNGGLFDVHELETAYQDIQISDDAFKRIFDFFDQYEWHLDTRAGATGKEINPDVIGYIFEKYINDRAAMGAYYTKEDITEYIAKNCILPYLFDETQRKNPETNLWENIGKNMLSDAPERYIYPALKHGINPEMELFEDLPQDIQAGIAPPQNDDITTLAELRKHWNKPAPTEIALPTETYRELIERRRRYAHIHTQMSEEKVQSINDFITLNLNIRQFAQDLIETTQDPELLRNLYTSLSGVTILDPTCGSGAFLFAALNILEPLYEACIQRMQIFIEEENRLNAENRAIFRNNFAYFRTVLEHIKSPQHPNLAYFIYKSIILQNLYGVDIMREATEIAKLRLFLKLVATVDADYQKPNLGIEPLPDVDFNIRAGNTLIGFANKFDLERGLRYELTGSTEMPLIEEKLQKVSISFKSYQQLQTSDNPEDAHQLKIAKATLKVRMKELNDRLNEALGKQYGITKHKPKDWDKWLNTHQPFHWLSEFYEIIHERKGFDVIIGNPPYVVYTQKNFQYSLKGYDTLICANLYAYCSERSYSILNTFGKFGMIIPNSSISADAMSPLQKIYTEKKETWISNYAWRPAKLFEGANMLLAIIITSNSKISKTYSGQYYKWYGEYRESLLENINYTDVSNLIISGSIPKMPNEMIKKVVEKMRLKNNRTVPSHFLPYPTTHKLYYFRAVLYYFKVLIKEPIFLEDGLQTTTGEMKPVYFQDEISRDVFVSFLSSSLFFLQYIIWSSCQVVNSRDFKLYFDIDSLDIELKEKLRNLGKKLQEDIEKNSKVVVRNYSAKGRNFEMQKQYFYIKLSKPIIDEIDKVLALHYGFSGEELDFILNYDIKYRLGAVSGDEEEE